MADDRAALGVFGEQVAVTYLRDKGWEILDRNWRCARGELDIVARAPSGEVVIVEVKARRTLRAGEPIEAVTWRKLARLRSLSAQWLQDHPQGGRAGVRFDVVGVLVGVGRPTQVRHVMGVAP